jgi:ELWxxDGT repeat protein
MATNFIGILLANSPAYTVSTGFSAQLYDADGSQTINVQSGASLSLLGSMGANTVRLSGNASAWQVYRDGSTATFINTDGSRIELAANTTAQTLQFDDRSVGLSIDTSGGAPAVMLGSQTLGMAAVAIEGAGGTPITPTVPAVGSEVKAPWTLLMSAGSGDWWSGSSVGGIFTSDGSAAGTQLNPLTGYGGNMSGSSQMGVRFKTAEDQSKAYFYNINGSGSDSSGSFFRVGSVGISDGTAVGTKVLTTAAQNSYLPGNFVTVVGDRLVMAGGDQGPTSSGKILVSDGTVSGTTLQTTDYGVPSNSILSDTANQAVWFSARTAPYGSELIRFSYATGATPSTTMVKDIFPGSSSGLSDFSYSPLPGALLPNGKLVIGANDGVNGQELWVSDGTEVGTSMIADLYAGSNSAFGWSGFVNFGNKVAFSVYLAGSNIPNQSGTASGFAGYQIVFTDGTSQGTSVLQVIPGQNGNEISILGQANGLLYFTAMATAPATGVSTKSIFSTDGITFTRLADINSSASLLGRNANKAYFKVSDATHGAELWAADLVGTGGFALVKDILAGSGSALAESFNTNPIMVGGKLMFNAYTSATQQALFVSDGTSAGTIQISSSLPTLSKVVGNTLVFATAGGVFGVDVASATPNALQLVNTTNAGDSNGPPMSFPTSSLMQTDADQVFFKTSNGDLYATNGSTAGTIKLAGAVENFKVVAENALFFVQNSATADAALWYSDGTSAGTRFVEALPANFNYDMENAVAITTVGVAAP